MAELAQRIERIRDHIQPPWSAERSAQIQAGLARRRRRARVTRTTTLVAALLLVLWVGAALLRPPPALTPAAGSLRFADGSTAVLLERSTTLRPLDAQAGRLSVALVRGAARFRVVPDRRRVFRVEAGAVSVEVLGTQFTVTRRSDRSDIAVEEGRVRVRWASGEALLGAGQRGTFPPAEPTPGAAPHRSDEPPIVVSASAAAPPRPEAAPASADAETPRTDAEPPRSDAEPPRPEAPRAPAVSAAPPLRRRPAPAPEPPRWQDLAQEGDYDRAFGALRAAPAPRDEPQELLLAADVARLSHHPDQAVAPLARILAHHRDDPRAALAAFTLGRLYLDELGQPRPAAAAFQTVQELDPEGPLCQDALTREVEAWSRAGDAVLARQRALLYLQRYPTGPRLRAVRRHGGLD